MADTKEFKCPACGGTLAFDSKSQKMKCEYCDTEVDAEAFKAYEEEQQNIPEDQMNWESTAGSEWGEEESKGLATYICKSCGGEIIGDESMGSSSCPYCGNSVVVPGKFSGMLKPDIVIPFKLDKKAARAALEKHLTGKKLLPAVFKDRNHIDEVIGVYVPFWLFTADVSADITYKGEKIRRWSTSKYEYTETKFYSIKRSGTIEFENVPVDGSEKMEDDLMESIEPFDIGEAVDFNMAYLAGYVADKYDVDAESSIDRANERIKRSAEDAFLETVSGYDSVYTDNSNIRLNGGKTKYALYPVWILNTTWNGEHYKFAMNGQTGKFVGNLPLDKAAYTKMLITSGTVFAVAAAGLLTLFWRFFM